MAFADLKNDFAFRCVLDIGPTGEQRARLDALGVGEIEALRRELKQARRWPDPSANVPS